MRIFLEMNIFNDAKLICSSSSFIDVFEIVDTF